MRDSLTLDQRIGLACAVLPIAATLPPTLDERVRRAIVRAVMDLAAVVEQPLGSNRGPEVDRYLRAARVPESVIASGRGYWCAAAVGQWWEDAGLVTPTGRASCDAWMKWGRDTNRWSNVPTLGAAVLYGVPGDARHIGLVVRVEPLVMSVEGNTSVEGNSRNGEVVSMKRVDSHDALLGYVSPFPAGAPAMTQ